MEDASVRRRVLISGRVQGVFYRDSCRRRSEAAGLAGTVRNCPDGRVEAVFEGPEDAVNALIAWCRRGPRLAAVDSVEVLEEIPQGLGGFSVR